MADSFSADTPDFSNVVELTTDQTWAQIRVEAASHAATEPALASFLHATILNHKSFSAALSYRIAQKLSDSEMNALAWRGICDDAFASDDGIVAAAAADLTATYNRDPACHDYMQPLLYFKGYQAIQSYRIAHWLMAQGREALALYTQSRMSEIFNVDIHPSAMIGYGLMLDHATGCVVGETARIGNNVSILHDVTLGGTGKADEDRHPKIGDGVLIGAGAKILGNIIVGDEAKVAAGSVVLDPVPTTCTVAGVPAKIVGHCPCMPSETMEQGLD